MQTITPFLWFDRDPEEVANFYCSIFKNSKMLSVCRNGKAAETATFRLNGQKLIALNGGPHFKFTEAISFFVRCKTQREADALWRKLLQGGRAQQCGWLKDKYGLSWQIIPGLLCEMLEDKDPAKAERVRRAMLQMVKIDIKGLKEAYAGQEGKI